MIQPSKQTVRRSGRHRIVNSFYAESLDQMKRSINKRTSKKQKNQDYEESLNQQKDKQDDCSLELEQNWVEAIITEGNQKRKIWVNIIPPKRKIILPDKKKKDNIELKKKPSFIKQPSIKEKDNQRSSLLNILLGAAYKVAAQSSQHKNEDQNNNKIDEQSQNNEYTQQQGKHQLKRNSKNNEKQEEIKKLAKMEAKYKNLSKRFLDLKRNFPLLT